MCQLDLLSALVIVHFCVCLLSAPSCFAPLQFRIPPGAADLGQVPSHCASCPLVNAKYAPIKYPGKCLILPLGHDHGQNLNAAKKGKTKAVRKRSGGHTVRNMGCITKRLQNVIDFYFIFRPFLSPKYLQHFVYQTQYKIKKFFFHSTVNSFRCFWFLIDF